MTLLITIFAAIISTIIWYIKDTHNTMKVGTLTLIYWGASLMWFIDAVFEYADLKEAYFEPAAQVMINDAFLGSCVAAMGLIIWLIYLLAKNPKNFIVTAVHK